MASKGELARSLHDLLERSPDLIFAADQSGALIYLNAAARARWGESLDRPATRLVPELASRASRFEWGEHGPGGVRVWFASTIAPIEGGYICTCTDVTELKHSEERLRRSEQLMVDTQGTAHLGTWEWDITQPTAIWSDELYRIYGLSPETYTPSYEAYLTMVHPDDRERVAEATNRVFHEHVPYSHDERIYRPDGSIRYLHTWAHPILDNDGKLVRLVGVCQDITDRWLAEERVRELNIDLERRVADRTQTIERSMRDLEAFNSMVSHDLRAPLTAIQVCTDVMLREKEMPERLRENVVRVQRSVKRMTELVEDLLALARVGHAELSQVELDVSALCTEILDGLRAGDPRDAAVSIESGIGCVGDAGLVRVALTNLIENAWKFTSQKPRTEISVATTERGGHRVIAIRDNGVGFDMNDATRMFTPFQRLRGAEAFPGFGVGLATVQRIVERHDGRIWAESSPNAGTTFYVDLPSLMRPMRPSGEP